jgi:hypothetical protein
MLRYLEQSVVETPAPVVVGANALRRGKACIGRFKIETS